MALGADEVNLLVFRYLQESGFRHSAFTFGHESLLARTAAAESDLPHGSLVSLVQKGLKYLEIERQVREDGTEAAHDGATGLFQEAKAAVTAVVDTATVISAETAKLLKGHESDVVACAFSHAGATLATGGADATLRLWKTEDVSALAAPVVVRLAPGSGAGAQSSSSSSAASAAAAAATEPGKTGQDERRDVGSLGWSPDGRLLACGGHSGGVRVMKASGADAASLQPHSGPVFAVSFSPSGERLASGALDGVVAVYDCDEWSALPPITAHKAPVLDVAWQSDSVLASCGSDRTVQVHRVSSDRAPRVFTGHSAEVNCVSWDATRAVLASCSDDATVRLWSPREGLLFSFEGHTDAVHSVEWSPGGEGGGYAGSAPRLVSASRDRTARLWDANTGACCFTLRGHTGLVCTARFSPDGRLVASAAFDRRVVVWNVADGRPVRTFEGPGGALAIDWAASGTDLAACFSDGTAAVLDLKG